MFCWLFLNIFFNQKYFILNLFWNIVFFYKRNVFEEVIIRLQSVIVWIHFHLLQSLFIPPILFIPPFLLGLSFWIPNSHTLIFWLDFWTPFLQWMFECLMLINTYLHRCFSFIMYMCTPLNIDLSTRACHKHMYITHF